MSDTPILLFLHGVTLSNNVDDGWRVRLDATLASLGYPGLANVQIIAPQYKHILDGTTAACNKDLPRTTIKRPSGAEAKRLRREFDSRMASLEYLLGRHNSGNGRLGADFLIDLAESLRSLRRPQIISRIRQFAPQYYTSLSTCCRPPEKSSSLDTALGQLSLPMY